MSILQKIYVCLVLVILSLIMTSCDSKDDISVSASYTLPFIPVSFSIDNKGNISVNGSTSLVTPVGIFSIGANVAIAKEDDSLVIIFRDKNKSDGGVDTVYRLKNENDNLVVVLNGKSTLQFSKRQVVIDITDGNIEKVEFSTAKNPIAEVGFLDNILLHYPFGYRPFNLFKWMYDESGFSKGLGGILIFTIRLVLAGILAFVDFFLIIVLGIASIVHILLGETARNIYLAVLALFMLVSILGDLLP